MSHFITLRADGTAEAAFAMTPAWHGLGKTVDHAMTSAEALDAAQLDWNVVQRPVAIGEPVTLETPEGDVESHRFNVVDSYRFNVRDDNGLILGMVSDKYQIVQNREAFAFLDQLAETGELKYEAAFSLKGGKSVVLLARMPQRDLITPKDAVERYILCSLGHDGTSAIKFGATTVRVVCQNTYSAALRKDGKTIRDFTVAHNGKLDDKLAQARHYLGLVNESFSAHSEQCRQLAQYKLSAQQWEEYLDIICPVPSKNDPDWTEQRERRIQETRGNIAANYRNSLQTFDGADNTAWAAFNAVTELVDHLPRRGATDSAKAEARFNVAMYGPGRNQKERAFETLWRIVSA